MKRMVSVTCDGTRLEQLKTLALVIAEALDSDDSSHSMAQLARQYRETLSEIAELEDEEDDDEIARIMSGSAS